jgi:hypothetical protein
VPWIQGRVGRRASSCSAMKRMMSMLGIQTLADRVCMGSPSVSRRVLPEGMTPNLPVRLL